MRPTSAFFSVETETEKQRDISFVLKLLWIQNFMHTEGIHQNEGRIAVLLGK